MRKTNKELGIYDIEIELKDVITLLDTDGIVDITQLPLVLRNKLGKIAKETNAFTYDKRSIVKKKLDFTILDVTNRNIRIKTNQ
jgi:hypothetical protein